VYRQAGHPLGEARADAVLHRAVPHPRPDPPNGTTSG